MCLGHSQEYGDQYIFIALDAETKLVVAHHVGKRDLATATVLFDVLKNRLRGQPQINTDAWKSYPEVIEATFGADCSYAQVGGGCLRINNPDPRLVSTTFVERFNGTLRMGMRRLTRKCNGFSKSLEMLTRAVDLFICHYNFCRVHRSLGKITTPAMKAGLTDHAWSIGELLLEGKK